MTEGEFHQRICNSSLVLLAMLILCNPYSSAQEAKSTLFDTLSDIQISRIVLQTDLDSLRENRLNDSEILANFQASNMETNATIELPVKVSVRSKSRRRYCSFPPLKLNFTKADLSAMNLDREDEYKIVTHCLDDTPDESHLIKEYMIYQLYRIITPVSHRAILVDMEYRCQRTDSSFTRKAVLLETFDELARNNKGVPCNCMGTPMDSIDRFQYELVAMFQFMVGNNDMDYKVERNLKLIKPVNGAPWIPVAYDFDYACIVNAPYVYTKLEDNRVFRPQYLGYTENKEHLPKVKELFIEKKDAIIDLIKEFEGLTKIDKRLCIQYVKDFYRKIQSNGYELPYKNP